MRQATQVVVIGGGQAALAAGYHLSRLGIDFVILDARSTPGGVGEPRPHLLCYGDWTGPAFATLIGVGRPARDAARAISVWTDGSIS